MGKPGAVAQQAPRPSAPGGKSLALVLALWAAGLGAAGQFAKISVIFPELQKHYEGAGASLGFLVSLISFLGIALGLFAGLFVARFGFRRLLLSALLLGAMISIWQSTMPALPLMLVSRAVEGLSHLVIVVAAPTLIAQLCAAHHRSLAMSLWSTFFGVAFAIAAWLGLPLVEARGIGSLFLAHGLFMAAVALLLFLMLPPQRPLPGGAVRFNMRALTRLHVETYRSPHKAAPAVGWVFYTLTFVSLLTVLPGFIASDQRAFAAGMMPLAAIAVSMSVGVALLRRVPAVRVVMVGLGLASLMAVTLAFYPGDPWLCIALFGALGLVQGGSFAAIPQLNPGPEDQAHANGAMAQMGNLGNTCGTPLLLAVVAAFGFPGLVGFVLVSYGCAVLVHGFMQRQRAR